VIKKQKKRPLGLIFLSISSLAPHTGHETLTKVMTNKMGQIGYKKVILGKSHFEVVLQTNLVLVCAKVA
jgi:hypothetical protein